jgi:hypothetical protein
MGLKGRATTKPGTLLKKDIPIRTGTDWNEHMPGFVEMDTVAKSRIRDLATNPEELEIPNLCLSHR